MRVRGALLAALLAGCGKLPTSDSGAAFLDIIPPNNLTLEIGDSLTIQARALDQDGAPVDVTIVWRTPDTTISVSQTGVVHGLAAGPGRVQALVEGSDRLISNFIDVTVKAPAAPQSSGSR